MGEINTRLQELAKKMEACGSNTDCQQKVMQEMQALMQEHQGLNKSMGQTMAQAQQGLPSCVGQIRPGWSCLPIKMTISDKTDRQGWDRYCENPGILPCDEKWYLARDFVFEYSAVGSGTVNYTKDFKEF